MSGAPWIATELVAVEAAYPGNGPPCSAMLFEQYERSRRTEHCWGKTAVVAKLCWGRRRECLQNREQCTTSGQL